LSKAFTKVLTRIHAEYKNMRDGCPKCGSENVSFVMQALCSDEQGKLFDRLTYRCNICKHPYSRFFELGENHWNQIGQILKES